MNMIDYVCRAIDKSLDFLSDVVDGTFELIDILIDKLLNRRS